VSLTELRSKVSKKTKRVGRGNGSGHGTFSCRGMKGQSARAGGRRRPGFEGGQTTYIQRMPKLKGFKNPNHVDYQSVNLDNLNLFEENSIVDAKALYSKNLIRSTKMPIKLLGRGVLEKTLTIKVHRASAKAIEAVKEKKGTLELIESK